MDFMGDGFRSILITNLDSFLKWHVEFSNANDAVFQWRLWICEDGWIDVIFLSKDTSILPRICNNNKNFCFLESSSAPKNEKITSLFTNCE